MCSSSDAREHIGGAAIPRELRERSQWVVTEDKKPVKPESGWNDRENQLAFRRAQDIAEQDHELAYVLDADDPYVLIDLDNIGPDQPTKVSEEAREIVRRLDTYTEASRSNTGLHLICRGSLLSDRSGKAELNDRGSIEVYAEGQYVVLTGNQLGQYDTITDGHAAPDGAEDVLNDLQREYLPKSSESDETKAETVQRDLESGSSKSADVGAKDIRRTLKEFANGGHASARKALSLWKSHSDSHLGYPSPSEADLAFASHLAFWCQEDVELMDECFRNSNRIRPKWDEAHYADDSTYGEATLQKAVQSNGKIFHGHYVKNR